MLYIKSQISMIEKKGEYRPIRAIPAEARRFANAASRRELKKKNRAEKNTTRKPGNSRGTSSNPR
jgi:hypothetical protein